MRALASFIMRGRMQATLVVVISAVLPLLFWLSAAAGSLVLLRRGFRDATSVIVGGLLLGLGAAEDPDVVGVAFTFRCCLAYHPRLERFRTFTARRLVWPPALTAGTAGELWPGQTPHGVCSSLCHRGANAPRHAIARASFNYSIVREVSKWRMRGLNPRPLACKANALPLS